MSECKLYLFGAPTVKIDLEPIDLPRRKVMALFSYIALAAQRVTRDRLATMLWPQNEQKSARAALRRELHALNQALGPDWLEVTREDIGLNPNANIEIDIRTFRQLIAAAQQQAQPEATLRQATDRYQGDFLAGFSLSDCPVFDDWQFFEGAALRRDYAAALAHLVQITQQDQRYEDAIGFGRRWLALDSLEEAVHRKLMQLYALAGQQAAAVRQYDECVRILDEELGVPPDEQTTTLYEQVRTRQLSAATMRSNSTTVPALPQATVHRDVARIPPALTVPHNLPAQNSSFVGREQELAEILALLQDEGECRLLTLVGPGGIGKTRLALELAQRFLEEAPTIEKAPYPDGIFYVPLESVADGEQLVATLVDAVGLPFANQSQLFDQLLFFLQEKRLLVVLDNVEQLRDHIELFSVLLQGAPSLTMLATSRESLSLQEEWLYAVAGFMPPPFFDGQILDKVQRSTVTINSAVQLFIQRARRNDSTLPLHDDEIPEVMLAQIVRICHLVDGLPLGLELAATWVRALSLQEIGDEIAADLDFLASTRRNIPERHRSMRAVLEQTWRLLTPAEQTVFCRLAYFQNGFTRQAATRIADASMMVLAALVRKSIISHSRSGRYRMHGLLRQFAMAHLQEDPAQYQAVAEAHSRYFGHLVTAWPEEQAGSINSARNGGTANRVISKDLLAQIGDDIDNIRQGWRWALSAIHRGEIHQGDQLELAGRYVEALFHFFDTRSRFHDGWTEFTAAVNTLSPSQSQPNLANETTVQLIRGRMLARLGWFAFQVGRPKEATTHLLQSLALLRPTAPSTEITFALNYLGAVYRHASEYGDAIHVLEESCHLCEESGNQFDLTVALNILGQIAYEERDFETAERYLEQGLALKITIGDRRGTTYSLLYLGLIAQAKNDPARAIRLFQESRLISDEYSDQRGVALALSNWADVEASLGHLSQAEALYQQSLDRYTTIYNLLGMVTILLKLGDLACTEGNDAIALQHYGTALNHARSLHPVPQRLEPSLKRAEQWLFQHR